MTETKDWGRHEGAVIIIPRRPDNKIILSQRLNKDRPFAGCYAAPGGTVEDGEEPRVAALRELKEETGLEVTSDRLVFLKRTGPHLTPVEQSGSGKPYYMSYFLLDLAEDEVLKRTEPEKQGQWEARTYGAWILDSVLVPGFHALVEQAYRTKRELGARP